MTKRIPESFLADYGRAELLGRGKIFSSDTEVLLRALKLGRLVLAASHLVVRVLLRQTEPDFSATYQWLRRGNEPHLSCSGLFPNDFGANPTQK